jgi:hypothetical protein
MMAADLIQSSSVGVRVVTPLMCRQNICPDHVNYKGKGCKRPTPGRLLFCDAEGLPITEHLPEGHEGRDIYGLIKDPRPDKGRALGRLEEKQGRRIEKRGPRHTAPAG